MKLRRRAGAGRRAQVSVGDHTDKLTRIPSIAHDEDERPTREDQHYGETLFNRAPVPLPRTFRRSSKRKP